MNVGEESFCWLRGYSLNQSSCDDACCQFIVLAHITAVPIVDFLADYMACMVGPELDVEIERNRARFKRNQE